MARPRTVGDETLLPKAVQLFWRNGYANTGIRELEQALGLTAPSLYNRFGSKEDLFHASLEYYLTAVVQHRIDRYLRSGDPLSGLRKFFDTTYDYSNAGTPPLSCLLVNTSIELGAVDPKAVALLARGRTMIRNAFRQTLERAQRDGALPEDADLAAVADALFLGLQGLLVTSKIEHNKASLKRLTDALFASLPIAVSDNTREE